ncbi:uncharacterized protein EMH_0061340 [Eimeria mitis]|uniref:Uncharacterized protein n=1 Tax=Eimeria mitis TaxID=44415 RepID=U6K4X2_9EIME|nr:uncharacterized protein EMH_0061340 [Eimeria mitis]CDJ30808.1 hypothetical protein, conserved [Eimeria mitis]
MKTRRQWEEQQRERARFWADAERDKNQTNTVGGQDASPYQQEILRRFQNKVEEEQRKREKEKGKNTQQAVDGAAIEREIAAHEEATVKAWKKFKEEMRAFGFNTTDSSSSSSSSSSSAEAKYKRRGTDVYGYKMWISREGSNKQKMRKLKLKVERYGLEAAAAAGLLVGAAAIVKHYKREKEKRREAEKEAVYNKQPHA